MNAKTTYILKMVLVMILILATPAVFFGSIGDNPLLERENATRTIAVVNEDIGADKENQSLDFGNEIASILKKDSNYEWTVISRSAADNGLIHSKYDAVVYIPTDFSKNIMSYESQQPVKAKFEYRVQDQLNSLNRERVLREIQTATNRVNGKISTLYWTYVSQDLENVRSQFDDILQKEIDFQNAMLAFYKPTSKSLTDEIEQQRSMLENIQATVKTASKASGERENNLNQFEQNLESFVQFVDQYQDYQNDQQLLLQKLQDENVVTIQALAGNQAPLYSDSNDFLNNGGQQMTNNLQLLNSQLQQNNEMLGELSIIRKTQVEKQKEELLAFFKEQENSALEKMQSTIISQKNELSQGTPSSNSNDGASSNGTQAEPAISDLSNANTSTTPSSPSMAEERAELQAIANEMNQVKASLEFVEGTTNPEQVQSAITSLPQLAERILNVEQKLSVLESGDNPLQKTVDELQALNNELLAKNETLVSQYNSLLEENKDLLELMNHSNGLSSVVDLIKSKEQQILNLENLDSSRKNQLTSVFNEDINDKRPVKMMEYYSSLVQFEGSMESALDKNQEKLDALLEKLNLLTQVNEQEQMYWNNLSLSMPYSQEQMTDLESQFTNFLNEYSQKVNAQQAAIQTDLSLVENSANAVMKQIQTFTVDTPLPADGTDRATVQLNQQGISQELMMMNDLVNSIGENQDHVVAYTNELEEKAHNVQTDADTLNAKWGANVDTTQLLRDDIFDVLGNAYVNGQKNGPVYDQLSTPLQISGETAVKAEENKVPPVVVLAIILISSLLIGYFSHYFKNAPLLVQGSMFILLNLMVGLIISLFGLNIYSMGEERAIEWTIFTILLLTAASTIVLIGFKLGNLVGWIASVGLVMFFIGPFLTLTAPNINYDDPMSKVYMSILYDEGALFIPASVILLGIIVVLSIIPFGVRSLKNLGTQKGDDQNYEA
jgi:putative membrane protein